MTKNNPENLPLTSGRDVDTLLSCFPKPLILRSVGNKVDKLILGLAFFGFGFFVSTRTNGGYIGTFLMSTGIAFFALIAAEIIKGPPLLILHEDYFSEKTLFFSRKYRWKNVINIKTFYNERVDSIFSLLPKEVGIVVTVDSQQNKDVILANRYGFTLQNFTRLMIGWQERALQKAASRNPPLQSQSE